ncbi:MAG: hypothetical protein Q9224_006743, partial [Gallowayella concinna]
MPGNSSDSLWHGVSSTLSTAPGQASGSSFGEHVIDGYKFLMSQYSSGDYIYLLGFSRGAYTARCLAEMVGGIGLLSRGNEHLVSLAWKTFVDGQSDKDGKAGNKVLNFWETFGQEFDTVHFLGLFDCVRPAGHPLVHSIDQYTPAMHIRHAVALNEQGPEYEPVLFHQDGQMPKYSDVKEVWFAGTHYEVGGTWPAQDRGDRQLGDIALTWMLKEMQELPK